MSFEFSATEAGFSDGLCGASNSESTDEYHYILFGCQVDSQHPENNGTYFEFDDQCNGGVNLVQKVVIKENRVSFMLINSKTISVICKTSGSSWQEFLKGVTESFGPNIAFNPDAFGAG